VVDAEAEGVRRIRRRVRRTVDGLAEQQRKAIGRRRERRCGREREIDLKAAGQEEDAIDARAGRIVEEPAAAERLHGQRPVAEHRVERHVVRDAERQVDVRPPVAAGGG
jgi:hypothetical protein